MRLGARVGAVCQEGHCDGGWGCGCELSIHVALWKRLAREALPSQRDDKRFGPFGDDEDGHLAAKRADRGRGP